MSNNPEKIAALEAGGIEVAERVPMVAEPMEQRDFYLKTKRDRMGHLFEAALSEPPIA
jgi:3,4-dihydroxy 2-butanone 4-phosphate synthase/GTP cyclohydrolase II